MTQTIDWLKSGSDTEDILDGLQVDIAERMRKFGRNFFSGELEYLTVDDLRRDYLELNEILIRDLPADQAVIVLERLIKPSYLHQKDRFQKIES